MKNLIRHFMPKRLSPSRRSSKTPVDDEVSTSRTTRKSALFFIIRPRMFFFIAGVFVLISATIALRSYFTVQHIIVVGAERVDGIDAFERAFLPFISESDVASQLAAAYPEFDTVSVMKDYPNRLVIRVSRATPVVQLKTVGGAYILDRVGRIIEKRYDPLTTTHLPMIQTTTPLYIGKMKLGSTAPVDGIDTAVQTVLALRKIGISIDAVAIQNPTMIVLNSDAMQLVVSGEKELDRQLWELTEVVSRSRKKGVSLASVDVRFSKPVVTLAR
ncbi:MAG: Cell division protein FtsQ [Microgenomates bacterium OLB22]|nr:MAG: Cell division protein FtsQ [Microgenomates bacterium OLB22]